MKRIITVIVAVAMMFVFSGCDVDEDHIGEAKPPSSSTLKGDSYQDVIKELEAEGFTNIKLEKIEDLITGWMTKEYEVDTVSVGGELNYDPDKWVANDIEIIVAYHAFPEEKESETEKPVSSEESSDTSLNEQKNEKPLTIDSCVELKNLLLLEDTSDPSIEDFVTKYKGQVIEFDGNIVYIDSHEKTKTRYDLLMYAGDYSESEFSGPQFKFEDVGVHDLGINDLYLPDFVAIGRNIRVRAEIKNFNSDTGIFTLDPVSITERESIFLQQQGDVSSQQTSSQPSAKQQINSSQSTMKSTESTDTQQNTPPPKENERTVYWADTGTKIHISANCSTIKSNINSGTEAEAIAAGRTKGYCKVCN